MATVSREVATRTAPPVADLENGVLSVPNGIGLAARASYVQAPTVADEVGRHPGMTER